MAETGFKGILVALLVTGLLMVLMISGAVMLSEQNDFAGSPADDSSLSSYKTEIEDSLGDAYTQTTDSDAVLSNSTVTTTTSFPFIESINGIWKNIRQAPLSVWNLTMGLLLEKALGENKTIVLTVLGAILSLMLIFSIIYLIATGDGR
jgi:hypothetical protein